MIIKQIEIQEIPQFNRAEIKALLEDGSVRVELFHVDESEVEDSREKGISFSEGKWPFELTEEEILELNPVATEAVEQEAV